MAISARLPEQLWPEIAKAATYLYNRTPQQLHDWKTPYQRFHQIQQTADELDNNLPEDEHKPYQAHLKVYGCKAFAMTHEAMKNMNRLARLNPKAWIGYLVGYDSCNIYRIWNPATNNIVRVRDVMFDESSVFPGTINAIKNELAHVDLEQLARWLNARDSEVQDQVDQMDVDQEDEEEDQPTNFTSTLDGVEEIPTHEEILDTIVVKGDASGDLPPYPTPPPTPPAAMFSTLFEGTAGSLEDHPSLQPWHAAFAAGPLASVKGTVDGIPITKAGINRIRRRRNRGPGTNTDPDYSRLKELLQQGKPIHQSLLPPPPRWHNDIESHPFALQFKNAEEDHLESHAKMASWMEVPHNRGIPDKDHPDAPVLDCMWVYVYKLDDHGNLSKCKARLVVRGDQQERGLAEQNYAATLAARSLRTLLSIAARFNLDLIQFDVTNAFVNAYLDDLVFMRGPPGYRKPGTVLKLQKALYGLRQSPLLWQRELTSTLSKLGFQAVAQEPCIMTKGNILIFFYVDDIVMACKPQDRPEVDRIVTQLRQKYQLTGGNDLIWFLGMEVHRDRGKRLIWLSQANYIERIARLAQTADLPSTPMTTQELFPFDGIAEMASVRLYQRKIGSLLYAAVTTRPDIAFATSRLARFNQNPGPLHHRAADRALRYLYATRFHALQLGGDNFLSIASDASFADNTLDRKSSQGYAIKLFGGLIAWRANKQDTVTTSTTEAELLALAQAAKEGFFVQRLLEDLSVQLDDHHLDIQCDNQQTIRLINTAIAKLQTKLRHVDIHNHWLRQEAQAGRIHVSYVPSNHMIADGLTKALTIDKHHEFVTMLGLVPIKDLIQARTHKELSPEALEALTGIETLDLGQDRASDARS
jgi:hypothetical protein